MRLRPSHYFEILSIIFCLSTLIEASTISAEIYPRAVTLFPQTFDLRIYYNCDFVIYEEGVCAGSWAVAIADTISDLICIQNNNFVSLSPQQILDCVETPLPCKNSTNSTLIGDALNVVASTGLTTQDCYPYVSEFSGLTGSCSTTCPHQGSSFDTYQIKGYQILAGVDDIKNYLLTNGSVLATFNLYNDLLLYNDGVYVKEDNAQYLGYHSIKIVGWGVDSNNVEYWTAANSWSINWGLNGYFNFYTTDTLLVQAYGIDLV